MAWSYAKGRHAQPTRSNAPRVGPGRQPQIRAESTGLGGHPAADIAPGLHAAVSPAGLTGHASACRSGPAVEHREHEQHQKTDGDGQEHKSEDPGSPTASTRSAVSRGSGGLVRLLCHAVLLRDATATFPVCPDLSKLFERLDPSALHLAGGTHAQRAARRAGAESGDDALGLARSLRLGCRSVLTGYCGSSWSRTSAMTGPVRRYGMMSAVREEVRHRRGPVTPSRPRGRSRQ